MNAKSSSSRVKTPRLLQYITSFILSLFFLLLFFPLLFPVCSAAQVTLAWDPNTEADLAGYKLYYGTASMPFGNAINVGNVTTHTLTDTVLGQTYFYAVTAYDTSNNESGHSNELIQIPLKAGWNLISFPHLTQDALFTALLQSISGQYEKAYTFKGCDTADPWKIYDPALPSFANDLQYVDRTEGIWVNLRQDTTIIASGAFSTTTSIPLCKGSNLFSYTGNQAKPVAEALSSISGRYSKLYTYKANDPSDPWKMYDPSAPSYANDLTVIEPGLGYWIDVNENCTLVVNN